VTEEIPYEDGNKKDILITMTREEYNGVCIKNQIKGSLISLICLVIGIVVGYMVL